MKYKAIIFDLDGVLCSTDKYHYLAWKQLADELGIYFDEQINNRLRGVGRMDSLNIILESYKGAFSNEEKVAMTEKKNTYYRKYLENLSEKDLIPEIKNTLDKLKAKKIKLGIGSSSKNTKLILKQLGLGNYFDAVSDGRNIHKSKPDPEVYLKASEFLNIQPRDCLVVEDALSGIQAAAAAQMDCAAIGDGIRYNLARYNLNTFSELLNIVQ
jgi:beta-phosphoglucomutase